MTEVFYLGKAVFKPKDKKLQENNYKFLKFLLNNELKGYKFLKAFKLFFIKLLLDLEFDAYKIQKILLELRQHSGDPILDAMDSYIRNGFKKMRIEETEKVWNKISE